MRVTHLKMDWEARDPVRIRRFRHEEKCLKLLMVNPNCSTTVTDVVMQEARRKARPNTELIPITTAGGTRNIDCYYGDYMGASRMLDTALDAVRTHHPEGVVLAGFGNVGIYALKELIGVPVVGLGEASMALASLLGHRFTVLTFMKKFIPYQEDLVQMLGFRDKCASVRAIDLQVERCATDRVETMRQLEMEAQRIVESDGCEVIVLACSALCGYSDELSERLGVPVVDPVVAGVKMVELLVEAGLTHSKLCKFAPPPQPLEDYHL